MKLRKMILAGAWYPDSSEDVERTLSSWAGGEAEAAGSAAVVPHAGWYYSGKIAARTLSGVCSGAELIVVIGGHLPAGAGVLGAFEDAFEIPGRAVRNRPDIITELQKEINIEEDLYRDNTVEVVLPMAAYFVPEADFLWLRAPADSSAAGIGDAIWEITEKKNIKTVVVGSTDLTHYGSSYNFQPEGRGNAAVDWVKKVNDAGIISRMLKMDTEAVIEHALKHKSACSAGAAAAAISFGALKGVGEGQLVEYSTSWDVSPSESFVGYAGIRF